MALKHSVYDTDTHFSVNPVTRTLKNESSQKTSLIQHDHNSERFTFEIPRMIEGHDMSLCDKVQVHYINIDAQTKVRSNGVYEVEDMQISPDGEDTIICSWLISHNATAYVGSLNFLLRFSCTGSDGNPIYVWNTGIYTNISVSNGIYNGEAVAEDYADILNEWWNGFQGFYVMDLQQTQVGTGDGAVNIWTALFGDGTQRDFEVRNGSRGATGYVGSIETINGTPLHFFVGTKEQYDALSVAQKKDLYAIITDDLDDNQVIEAVEALQNTVGGIMDGIIRVPNADRAWKDANGDLFHHKYFHMYGDTYEGDPANGFTVYVDRSKGATYLAHWKLANGNHVSFGIVHWDGQSRSFSKTVTVLNSDHTTKVYCIRFDPQDDIPSGGYHKGLVTIVQGGAQSIDVLDTTGSRLILVPVDGDLYVPE